MNLGVVTHNPFQQILGVIFTDNLQSITLSFNRRFVTSIEMKQAANGGTHKITCREYRSYDTHRTAQVNGSKCVEIITYSVKNFLAQVLGGLVMQFENGERIAVGYTTGCRNQYHPNAYISYIKAIGPITLDYLILGTQNHGYGPSPSPNPNPNPRPGPNPNPQPGPKPDGDGENSIPDNNQWGEN